MSFWNTWVLSHIIIIYLENIIWKHYLQGIPVLEILSSLWLRDDETFKRCILLYMVMHTYNTIISELRGLRQEDGTFEIIWVKYQDPSIKQRIK